MPVTCVIDRVYTIQRLTHYLTTNTIQRLTHYPITDAVVTRPERPKGAKDDGLEEQRLRQNSVNCRLCQVSYMTMPIALVKWTMQYWFHFC